MSSSQYIKIFNDTVLKQSILQGYESQRTDENLGKFTMGELAFTRDTGRVFVGNYTDNSKTSDLGYVLGGILTGNKYYGASNGGKTLTHCASYNSSTKVYNGDYTFDVNSCSLILFDNNIKRENKIDNITLDNKINDIYNDGFIKMRILEPDGDTIKLDDSSNHNVLKADFNFDRVAEYFGGNWKKESDTIEIKNIELENNAICKLPSTVKFNDTSITTEGESEIGTKFPSYLTCVEKTTNNTYNLSFKKFSEVINITAGDGIEIEKSTEDSNDEPFIKISCNKSISSETQPTPNNTQIDINGIYNDPWEINMGGANIGVLTFNSTGDKITANKYEGTEYKTPTNANNNATVELSLSNEDTEFKNGMNTIKSLYSGGYYNVGLNYLKNANISITSNKNYDIKSFGTEDGYLYVPYHAQSVILQVTTSTSNAVVKHINNSGPILFLSTTSGEVTTVEVPLIPYGFWSIDTSPDTDPPDKGGVEESKTFLVYFTDCTVKLLGYRV